MSTQLNRIGLRCALLLAGAAVLSACPQPEAPEPSQHAFTIKIGQGGVTNKNAIDRFELRIAQIPKETAMAAGYGWDLFAGLASGQGNYKGIPVTITKANTPDGLTELVFSFIQNPFKDSQSGDFNVVHAPWAFWDATQKKMTKQPPAFRIKLSAFKNLQGFGEVLVAQSQGTSDAYVSVPQNILFAGPLGAAPNRTWPATEQLNLNCVPAQTDFCISQDPDASVRPPNPPDAGVPDAGLPDEYTLTDLKILGTNNGKVTEGSNPLTVEITVNSRMTGRDISRLQFRWQIAKRVPGTPDQNLSYTNDGFNFRISPKSDLAQQIDRGTQRTLQFELVLKPVETPDGDGGVIPPMGSPVAAGDYAIRARVSAFNRTAGMTDGDGGTTGGTEVELLNAAEPPIVPLLVQSKPNLVFVPPVSTSPDHINIEGSTEIYQGDRRVVKIQVTNPGQAALRNVKLTTAIKGLSEMGMPEDAALPGLFLDAETDQPGDGINLGGGSTQIYTFTLRVTDEAPANKRFRVEATVTGRDENLETAELITVNATPKDMQIRGAARLVITETTANYTTAFLGQGATIPEGQTESPEIVKIKLKVHNEGYDAARILTPAEAEQMNAELPAAEREPTPFISNPRIRFINRAGVALKSARATDDATTRDTSSWVLRSITPDPSTVTLQPGNGQPGPSQELELAFYVVNRDNGQVGNNILQAAINYVGVARARRGAAPVVTRPWQMMVIFQPGPQLQPPQAERDGDYGAAMTGLGFVSYSNQLHPGLAIGAPSANASSGKVYYFQFVTGTEQTTVNPITQTGGLAGARLGSALTTLGNWDRANTVDKSAEVGVGRPGQNLMTLFSLAQSAPVTETLPSSFSPCTNCDLGAAVAANPRGLREPFDTRTGTVPPELVVAKQNRRVFVVGAPRSNRGLGRVDVFWQRLAVEGGTGALSHRRVDGEQDSSDRPGGNGERFGTALAVGDFDGDGHPDVLVASPGFRKDGDQGDRGRVRVLRGPDFLRFAPAWSFIEGETAGEKFGTAVANIGDIDGDGKDDFAVGAPDYTAPAVTCGEGAPMPCTASPERQLVGRVTVFSGGTGLKIYDLVGNTWTVSQGTSNDEIGERFGSSLAPLFTKADPYGPDSDFNNDKRTDFAVGAPGASPAGRLKAGAAYVYSAPKVGNDPGKLLLRFDGQSAGDEFGAAVAGGGDLNQDGFHDLLVGAPKYVQPGDPNQIKRGRVYVYYGAAFEPFQDPARVDVLAIDDGATGTPAVRSVTIPRSTTATPSQVRVKVHVRNGGDRTLEGFAASMKLRRKGAGDAFTDVEVDTAGCGSVIQPIVQPRVARICPNGALLALRADDPDFATATPCPFDAAQRCRSSATFPTSLRAAQAAQLEFLVTIGENARPEEWQASLIVPNIGGVGTREIDPAQRRKWVLQQFANLQVLGILTVDGNTDLGFTSINRGAPVEIAATIVNTGEATIKDLQASLQITAGLSGGDARLMTYTPRPLATRELRRNDRVEARFVLSVDDQTLPNPVTPELIRLIPGQQFNVAVIARGEDKNTLGLVESDPQASDPLRVTSSRATLRVVRVEVPSTASRFVVPGQLGVPFETRVVYDSDSPATGTGAALRPTGIGLRFSVANDQWVVRADSFAGRAIGICVPNQPCTGEAFSARADVPQIIAPGPVSVEGVVTAIDEDAAESGVFVRGFSNRATDPQSVTDVQVLGLGTKLVEITRTDSPGFGAALAPLGDVDGDGRADFAVSAPGFEDRGKVFFFNGRLSSISDGTGTVLGDAIGDLSTKLFGQALAGGYNLTALDRTADLVVGSPAAAPGSLPQATPLFMAATTGTPGPAMPANLSPRSAADRAGSSVAIGDVNNDGCPDRIVGVPGAGGVGAVCVRFGRASFDGARECAAVSGCGEANELCWSEGVQGDEFGAAVAAWMPAGNARFLLAVGAPGVDVTSGTNTLVDAGRVYVYPELSCGASRPVPVVVDADKSPLAGDKAVAHAGFGSALAATRLVGLATPDNNPPEKLIIGAPGIRGCEIPNSVCPTGTACSGNVCAPIACAEDTACGTGSRCLNGRCDRITVGRVYALSENPDQNKLQVVAAGESATDRFGAVVAAVGDIDGDNVGDIGIGAPGAKFGALRNGRAQVVSGSGFFTLLQFGTPNGSVQNVGRSIAGVGRLNDDSFNDIVVGADGKVFLAAGLERPTSASLRIDSVTAGVPEISTGQTDVPVTVRVTNIGRAEAYLKAPAAGEALQPQLLFKAAIPGPRTAPDGRDSNYTTTQVARVVMENDQTREEVLAAEIGGAECSTNRRCIAPGSQAVFRLKVRVGDAQVGNTTIDARADANSTTPTGQSVSAQSSDLTDAWQVKTPPAIEVRRVFADDTVVFQGQRAVPVRVTLRNNQADTKPTRVEVRLKFRDTATNTEIPAGYAFAQLPAATEVPIIARACTTNTQCQFSVNGVAYNENCAPDGFCTVTNPETTVTVNVTLAANAQLGEQELVAEVNAPPMPNAAIGPSDVANRHRWTVLPAGVVEILSVAFKPKACNAESTDCGEGSTCTEGFCSTPANGPSLSAGQQRALLRVKVKNSGALILRDVRPAMCFPRANGCIDTVNINDVPTRVISNARTDIPVPAIEPDQPTVIPPGGDIEIEYKLDIPPVALLNGGFGPVVLDAVVFKDARVGVNSQAARDANHEVDALGAAQTARFTLQRPASPAVEQVQLQGLIYRNEPKVKLSVTIANGAVPPTCTLDSNCTGPNARCVDGRCSGQTGVDPTATWSGITASICFQHPAPPPGSTATCTYPVAPATVTLAPQGEGTPGAAQNPNLLAGNARVQMLYEFNAPADAPIGNTRARIVFQGKDRNTNLAIGDLVFDRVTFLMNRDNRAGELLAPGISAPQNAVRFGAALAAGKVTDVRKGIIVVGAPESEPSESGPRGHVYVYGMQAGAMGAPATLEQLALLQGQSAGDRFGDSVAILRNAEGAARYIAVAAPGRSEQGVTAGGVVYFYDAQTYTLVNRRTGFEDNLRLGKIVAAGNVVDVSGDGGAAEDLVVGLPGYNGDRGRVLVISGAPPFDVIGAPIDGPVGSNFGSALIGANTLGNGTRAGFLVGAPAPTGAGLTGMVRSYASGGSVPGITVSCLENNVARNVNLPASAAWGGRQNLFGTSLALIDSIDGDTCPDIVVGAPGEDVGVLERAGVVYVARSTDGYFPATPTTIRASHRADSRFGAALVSVGDWNGDGKPEYAVGAPSAAVGGSEAGFPASRTGIGAVTVFLGDRDLAFFHAEGKHEGTDNAPPDQNFGATLAAVDLNEDGILDLIVGAPGALGGGSNGRVYVYQGGQLASAAVRVNSADDRGREILARGIPVAPWEGLEVRVTATNAGRSTAFSVVPTPSFVGRDGQPVAGISIRSVTPCCEGSGCVCAPGSLTTPSPRDLPTESTFTWTYKLDVASVTKPQAYAMLVSLAGRDGLTNGPIMMNSASGPVAVTSASTPVFFEVVQRNHLLGTLTGDVPATPQNTSSFGASVSALDVDGDGFRDLVIADPRQDRADYGKVHVYSGRNLQRKLISIEAPSGEGRNLFFGAKVVAARVGATPSSPGTPMVFVTQPDQSDPGQPAPNCGAQALPGGVFAFPLDCSASTCAIKTRTPAGDRTWRAVGICSEGFGAGAAWLGVDRINGTDGEFLAVTNDADTGGIKVFNVNAAGIKLERQVDFEPAVVDAGPPTNRHCGGPITARRRGEAGATESQFAVLCNDLDTPGDSGVRVHTPSTGLSVDYLRKLNNDPAPARQEGAPFGESIALLNDMTGDGRGDVLIGWPRYSAGSVQGAGRVELWAGATATPPFRTPPVLTIENSVPVAGANLGMSISNIGDLDGDGTADFAIGIPGQRTVRVYSGLSTDAFKRILMTIVAPEGDAYNGFGKTVVGVGDVNNDGFMDVAVSAPDATVEVNGQQRRGAVYIYAGGHP